MNANDVSYGSLYDPDLSIKDIAARLRKELKPIVHPHKVFVRIPHNSSIDITIKGAGLVTADYHHTEEAKRLEQDVKCLANKYNRCLFHDEFGDCSSYNFYLNVDVENLYTKTEIEAEAKRLQEVYTITDKATWHETTFNIDHTPLIEQALNYLHKTLEKPKARPETSLAVAEEMDRWITKVKGWFDPDVQYNTGPRYFRVVKGTETICLVDRKDGTIHKAAYKAPAPNSTRGTIFDGVNVFGQYGLLYKDEYTRMMANEEK